MFVKTCLTTYNTLAIDLHANQEIIFELDKAILKNVSKFEEFKEKAKSDIDSYRESIKGNGGFEYAEQSDMLFKLQNNLNSSLFIYMFGEQTGNHYAYKFIDCKRNLLTFLKIIDSEAKFFILHELKNNKDLFAHG